MNHIKYRNMFLQVLLFIMTFGFYGVYWFYQTAKDLKSIRNDPHVKPALWTLCLFLPFLFVYSYYKYSELYSKYCTENLNKWLLFALWIVFPPAIWFLVQNDLNDLASPQPELTQKA